MNTQDQRLFNKYIIRNCVCLHCWGTLVEKHVDGQDVVVCASDPTHEGFTSQAHVTHLTRLQRLQAAEVLANYPQLNPSPIEETATASIDLLFG